MNNKLTYKQSMTGSEAWRFLKAIGFPFIIMLLSIYTISVFEQFGSKLLAPLIAAMWGVAVIEAFIMGSQRKSIINEALGFIGVYNFTLVTLKVIIAVVSNVSQEQLTASFSQNITISQSSAVPGYLQNILWMSSVFIPIGYLGMQAKRIFQFRKKISKAKFFEQTRSIRNNNDKYSAR